MPIKLERRMLLRGTAGFTLGIPFLYSLVGRQEEAVALAAPRPKYFAGWGTSNGGLWSEFLYPPEATLTDSTMASAGHAVRRGPLALSVADGVASLSTVLSASSSLFTSSLLAKLNVLRGFDVSFYMGHHGAGHLGNFGRSDQGDELPLLATIDQVLAASPAFYGDAAGILQRSIVVGHEGMSWEQQQGGVTAITPNNNPNALFQTIFRPAGSADPTAERAPIVDLVIEDYRRLRDSNRRLSAGDRVRLEEHLARLAELERKVNVTPAVSCGEVQEPMLGGVRNGTALEQAAAARVFNDIVVAAFACDTCRVATFFSSASGYEYSFSDYTGDWHGEVAHGSLDPTFTQEQRDEYERLLVLAAQVFFEGVYLDLVSKLDAIDQGDGSTLLDHALVQWSHEAGTSTHTQIEMPVITAGSAGGFFQTGNYVDYRQRVETNPSGRPTPGILYNQYLGNVLQAMGLDPSEFNSDGTGGYGRLHMGPQNWYPGYQAYSTTAVGALNDLLAYLV